MAYSPKNTRDFERLLADNIAQGREIDALRAELAAVDDLRNELAELRGQLAGLDMNEKTYSTKPEEI